MSRHNILIEQLKARLQEREVESLVYFHTDHFEPWRSVGTVPAVGRENVDMVGEFCRTTDRIEFARRLTLFYKPHLNYALRYGDDLIRADPRDLVGFQPRADFEEQRGREAMREVVDSAAHDVQVHIHHENYTATTAHTDPAAIAWFSSPLGKQLDAQRLELAIRLNRDIISRETRRRTSRWFFVHGHWALNASDSTSCTITNEIEILHRNGCRGDFTFPAGRQHVNPRIKVPYLCDPIDRVKGYDSPEAHPEVACGSGDAAEHKFFVWSSDASNKECSIDYMSAAVRKHLDDTERSALALIDKGYIANRVLFIKTHAHSVHPFYFEHTPLPVFPHQFPATQVLLAVIFEAAAAAGLQSRCLTVPEVYELLVNASKPQATDLAHYHRREVDSDTPGLHDRKRPGTILGRLSRLWKDG